MTPEELETYFRSVVAHTGGARIEDLEDAAFYVEVTRVYKNDRGEYYREDADAPVYDLGKGPEEVFDDDAE